MIAPFVSSPVIQQKKKVIRLTRLSDYKIMANLVLKKGEYHFYCHLSKPVEESTKYAVWSYYLSFIALTSPSFVETYIIKPDEECELIWKRYH